MFEKLNQYRDIIVASGVIGFVANFFGTLKITYIILMLLITIDTITGMATAIIHHRFSSKGLSKFVKKVITYSLSVLTVRMLEIGITDVFETTMFSSVVAAFLIITETISILENLALLGVPFPADYVNELIEQLKIPGLNKILRSRKNCERDIAEVEDIIKYQLPTIEDPILRKVLEIKFNVWKNLMVQINSILADENSEEKELFYYKVLSIIEMAFKEMEGNWKTEKIPQVYLDFFNSTHQNNVEVWLAKVKEICFSNSDIITKKEKITESIVILLYKTILDAHKGINVLK